MAWHRYGVYGVDVMSNVPLVLAHDVFGQGADVRVVLELGDGEGFPAETQAHKLLGDDGWFRHVVLGDGSVYMRWEGLFDFIITANGQRIRCRRLFDCEVESFEAYLTSFAISAALIQQGEEPLHASVVATARGVAGLIGPSGAGKSTLAAHLISRGDDLLTDDMLRVEFRDKVALAFPGPRRIKLFKEPAQMFFKWQLALGRFNPMSEKFIFQTAPGSDGSMAPQPLSALYFLDWPCEHVDQKSISVERLSGVELFKTIAASTFNSRLNTPDRLSRQFRFAERLAATVPVYRLTYPRDYNRLEQVADLIDRTISA
jgi:hypothetical protein